MHRQDPNSNDSLRVDPQAVIDAFNGTAQEIADQNAIVMREMMQTYGKASEYESFTTTIPQGEPVMLVGMDLSRMKLHLRSQGEGVYVGKRSELAGGGQGYLLAPHSDFETSQIGELYARLSPTGANRRENLFNGSSPSVSYGVGGAGSTVVSGDGRFYSNESRRITWTAGPTSGWSLISFDSVVGPASVIPGKPYTFSVRGIHSWGGSVVQITIEWRDANGRTLGYTPLAGAQTLAANDATQISGTTVAPFNARSANIFYDAGGGTFPPAGGQANIGDWVVEQGTVVNPWFNNVIATPVPVSVWVEKSAQ